MDKELPFQITSTILNKVTDISRELGALFGAKLTPVPIKLRRENKIKTIQSSLAIEGNTLSLEQVSAMLEGKRVIGQQKDIQEVNNAIKVYDNLLQWNPLSMQSFKQAHQFLMQDLIVDNGKWRVSGVGIFKNQQVTHVAPPAKMLPSLMENLFKFIKADSGISWLIKACVFHYELEFIHPFSDGNGRMGRLWQQLLLMKEEQIFEFISVESIIKTNQEKYYKALGECDKAGNSTAFIEFSLEQILIALKQYTHSTTSEVVDAQSRLQYAQEHMGGNWFTRKDYIMLHKNISSATASRDLAKGLESGMLIKQGDKNQAKYSFKS